MSNWTRPASLVPLVLSGAAAVVFGALAASGRGDRGGAHLELATEPTGASVFLDGVFRGTSPLDLRLPSGPHSLRLEKFGYEPLVSSFELPPGRSTLSPRLSPLELGTLEVRSKPPGAEVFLDEEFRGVTPLTARGVPVGPHSLRLEKAYHAAWTGTLLVRAGKVEKVAPALTDRILQYLEGALAARPQELYRYLELGHYLVIVGDVERAAEVYRRGLELAQMPGADRGAVSKLSKQIQKDRQLPGGRGREFGEFMNAVRKEMQRKYPKNVQLAIQRVARLEKQGRREEAVEALQATLRKVPNSVPLREHLARQHLALGQGEAALGALRKVFSLTPELNLRQRLGRSALESSRKLKAKVRPGILKLCISELKRALPSAKTREHKAYVLGLIAKLHRAAGDPGEAVRTLQEALAARQNPAGRAAVELELGTLCATLGRAEEARGYLRRAASSPEKSVRDAAEKALSRMGR